MLSVFGHLDGIELTVKPAEIDFRAGFLFYYGDIGNNTIGNIPLDDKMNITRGIYELRCCGRTGCFWSVLPSMLEEGP
jgi:hypothetical protein